MSINLLLTGEPKSGKSTILQDALGHSQNVIGFLTKEVIEGGKRVGFKSESENGSEVTLASEHIVSDNKVGRFYVQLSAFDAFVNNLPKPEPDQIVYIDEIGEMQLMSSAFRQLLIDYLDGPNPLIGTVSKVYENGLVHSIKDSPDTVLVLLNVDNRKEVAKVATAFVKNFELFNALSKQQQTMFTAFARESATSLTALYKLFHNTLHYVHEGRIKILGPNKFKVQGDTHEHIVEQTDQGLVCDCDLFKKRGQFQNVEGNCSHIYGVELTR